MVREEGRQRQMPPLCTLLHKKLYRNPMRPLQLSEQKDGESSWEKCAPPPQDSPSSVSTEKKTIVT
jgi:hypothetical protein